MNGNYFCVKGVVPFSMEVGEMNAWFSMAVPFKWGAATMNDNSM